MGRKKREYSVTFRDQAVSLHLEGKSYRQIAAIMKVSFSTIRSIVMKYKNTGTTENKPRSGRPRVTILENKETICLEQEHSLGSKALSTRTLDDKSTSNKMENSEGIKMEPIEILPPLKREPEPEDETHGYFNEGLCEVEIKDCNDPRNETWTPRYENVRTTSVVETLRNTEQEIQNNLPELVVTSCARMDALVPSTYQQSNGQTLMKRSQRKDKEERTSADEDYGIHRLRSSKDEFAMYDENMGNRLRKLNPRAQMCVKNLINVILFKAEAGCYDLPQAPLEDLSETHDH